MRFKDRENLTANVGIHVVIILLFSVTANGRQTRVNWNQFRGPNGQGVAEADRIPVHFSPDSNVLWKTVIGEGQSSPVIWNDRIFLTAYESSNESELIALCVDREQGRILWRQVVQAETKVRFHPMNGTASSTPAADETHVYVYFGTYGLFCYDHAGNNFGEKMFATPAIAENRIYLRTTGDLYALGE